MAVAVVTAVTAVTVETTATAPGRVDTERRAQQQLVRRVCAGLVALGLALVIGSRASGGSADESPAPLPVAPATATAAGPGAG
jgi:hypothetical protein